MIMSSVSDSRFLLQDNDDQDEEQLFERQALLNQDYQTNENHYNNTGHSQVMRKRGQQARLSTRESEFYELKNTTTGDWASKAKDLTSEPPIDYTFYDIQPNDTLQSLCLRYACSANHVKRINGIMNDQEFYGLRRIKLPLGKLGILNDILINQDPQQAMSSADGDFLHSTSQAPGSSFRRSLINSPGSALSVSSKNYLVPSGFSTDRLNEIQYDQMNHNQAHPFGVLPNHSHSHSFSSMRDFADHHVFTDVNQNHHHPPQSSYPNGKTTNPRQQNYIKSNQPIVPDLVTDVDNVEKVFEDLDYHVELAKVAAKSYDQRAAELVDRIDVISAPASETIRHNRVSKIPQLFFCSENFGLNLGKLLVFIIVVCLIFPLIGYINQTNHSLHAKSSPHSLSSQELIHHDTI